MHLLHKTKVLVRNFFGNTDNVVFLNILHVFNDGTKVGMLILLPFIAKELHINLTQVGLLGTILNVCLILFAVPAGYVAARIGGLKTLLIALLLYGFGFFASGFAFSFILLLFTFFVAGMGFGVFHPISLILLTKWVEKHRRGREMGNFTAIGDIGTVGIPALLVFFVPVIGWRLVAIGYGIGMFVLLLLFYKRSSLHDTVEVKRAYEPQKSFLSFLTHKQFLLAASTGAIDGFASASLFIFLPFLLLSKGISASTLGMFAGVFFIGSFVGKALLGRFVDTFGNKRVFILSEIIMAFFIIAVTKSNSFFILMLLSLILGAFTRGTAPVSATMVSDVVDTQGHAAKAFGINGVLMGIATTIAPTLLGVISDRSSITSAFYAMAFVAICAAIPALFLKNTRVKIVVKEKIEEVD